MRLTLPVLVAFLASSSAALHATDLTPTVIASIHDSPMDGLGDSFNATPFTGLLRKVTSSGIEDRAIQEFNAAAFAGATLQSAQLSGGIGSNNAFDVGVRTFDFVLYAGNGTADFSDFQVAGTVVGSASYHPPITTSLTYSFDVTSTVQTLITNGATWIGLAVRCSTDPNYPNILDDATSRLVLVVAPVTGTPYCFGDGSGAACPCANTSVAGANVGCLNSLGLGGKIVGTGLASVSADTLRLDAINMPNSSCLYFQGTAQQTGGAGFVFGDGLRCAAGTILRLGTKSNVLGASHYPDIGDASIAVRGLVPSIGGTRYYQVWYRNAANFCTSATFNLSNGWAVPWVP